MIDRVYDILRPLFPGHWDRDALDVSLVVDALNSVIHKWHRYAKTVCSEKRSFCTTDLLLETHTEMCTLQREMIPVEPRTMDIMCKAHSRLIAKYLLTLFKYTDIHAHDLCLTDFILAIAFLQRTNFKVEDVPIFTVDLFLDEYLPSAFYLGRLSSIRTIAFTSTKNAVQSCIVTACKKGVNPSLLAYSPIRLSDVFVT